MSSAIRAEAVKAEIKEDPDLIIKEEVFVIKEEEDSKPDLATVRPIQIEKTEQDCLQAEPRPSTSRAVVAEVRVHAPPPAQDLKFDPFDLGPRPRSSPPPPPAYRAKRRSVPGGHASAQPRLKFQPYQARR